MVMPPGPMITITSPKGMTNPNTDTILTSSTVKVSCNAVRSDSPDGHDINESTVAIGATYPGPKAAVALQGTVNAIGKGVFEAEFNLADVPNGPVTFTCQAQDTGMPPVLGKASVDTLLDLGPTIDIAQPTEKGIYALKQAVPVSFSVKASKVTSSDKEATPKNINLDVLGQSFKFTEDPKHPGEYATNIDFNDKQLFPMAPVSAEFTVSAASSRTPKAPVRSKRVTITLDATGPSISANSPKNLQIVRGNVLLSLKISDPAGVKLDTVVGTINQDLFILNDWKVNGDTFTEQFDTRQFSDQLTQLTINVKASDNVGNESTFDMVLRLDNQPPLLSLDPPKILWESGIDPTKALCSDAFDPVGDDATNDLATVLASSLYRVMIWDQTNHSPGANYDYLAGVKDSTVKLFVQGPNVPLLVDTNSDGVCDEINPATLMNSSVQLSLTPLTVRGMPYYSSTASAITDECKTGTAMTPPDPLCPATTMTFAPPAPVDGNPPSIYAFAPTNGPTGPCEGDTWELPVAGNGWKCLAARAEDNIGNIGISAPLRVCLNDGVNPPACNASTDTPPTCTDGCAFPPGFRTDYLGHAR
jgi:hypothetical protein